MRIDQMGYKVVQSVYSRSSRSTVALIFRKVGVTSPKRYYINFFTEPMLNMYGPVTLKGAKFVLGSIMMDDMAWDKADLI